MLTEIIFILDRSGSMHGLESDTIGGYNAFLEEQKNGRGDALITTVLFNDRMKVIHERVPISEVRGITKQEYTAAGSTALLDAVGETVRETERMHELWPKTRPDHTVMVIITDGYENASRKYTRRDIRNMIGRKKEEGWEFIFLGANIDAGEAADDIGIGAASSVNYHADKIGIETNFRAVGKIFTNLRSTGVYDEEEGLAEIARDYHSRKR
ncbi:MAG: VWA domain-containing protein [Solobacterium sp.]|nr:VWA domain-containing protein [Solobacterium sp.]